MSWWSTLPSELLDRDKGEVGELDGISRDHKRGFGQKDW